jgi:hypothetical protein
MTGVRQRFVTSRHKRILSDHVPITSQRQSYFESAGGPVSFQLLSSNLLESKMPGKDKDGVEKVAVLKGPAGTTQRLCIMSLIFIDL